MTKEQIEAAKKVLDTLTPDEIAAIKELNRKAANHKRNKS